MVDVDTFHAVIALPQSGKGLCIALLGTAIGLVISFWTIYSHLVNYNRPDLQRYIIRILFATPVFCFFSFLSLLVPLWLLFFGMVRDLYEAMVIYSLLALVLEYCGGESSCVQAIQQYPGSVTHIWPLTCLLRNDFLCFQREIPLNPNFVKVCKRATLQFVFIKPMMTFVSWSLLLGGRYQTYSWRIIECVVYNASYSVALYALVLFYMATKHHPAVRETKSLRKFVSVKVLVFFTFWQSLVIALIPRIGFAQSSQWQNLILCCELPFMALLQLWAFPTSEHCLSSKGYIPTAEHNPETSPSIDCPNGLERGGFNDRFPGATVAQLAVITTTSALPQPPPPPPIEPDILPQCPSNSNDRSNSKVSPPPPPPPPNAPVSEILPPSATVDKPLRRRAPRNSDGSNVEMTTSPASDIAGVANENHTEAVGIRSLLYMPFKRVADGFSTVTDKEARKMAIRNAKDVVSMHDVVKDVYYNFSSKYGNHSLLPICAAGLEDVIGVQDNFHPSQSFFGSTLLDEAVVVPVDIVDNVITNNAVPANDCPSPIRTSAASEPVQRLSPPFPPGGFSPFEKAAVVVSAKKPLDGSDGEE